MESDKCLQRQLGEVGLEYVRARLSDGGPIAEQHLEHLNYGFVWEFIPDNSGGVQTSDLSQGGRYDATEAKLVTNAYALFFRDFLGRSPSHILLSEDQLFRMNDRCMLDKEGLFEYGGVTYFHFPLGGEQLSKSSIEGAISRASQYPSIVLATRRTFDEDLPSRGVLQKAHALMLGEQVQHVLVGAYDEEGYVMWSRRSVQGT